jgi:DNA recombination protein RmuC
MTDILLIIILILLVIVILIQLLKRPTDSAPRLLSELSRMDQQMRHEFSLNREESNKGSRDAREELNRSFKTLSDAVTQNLSELSLLQKSQLEVFSAQLQNLARSSEEKSDKLIAATEQKLAEFKDQFTRSASENRQETTQSLKSFEERFTVNVKDFNELQRQKFSDLSLRQEQLKSETENKLEKIRETVEKRLQTLQEDNARKLEEMRQTVDEKLHATLEKRFNESFTVISERLEQVHKGLGEMQSLATNVGDLKKVMTNIKTRGILGEYQLANLLEDLLTNEQYEKNVKTKAGSGAIVEFAIKMPNNNQLDKSLWLPVDSKFPKEDYENLVDAYDNGDAEKIEPLRRAFKQSIIKNARDIREKYIDPPNTTEYGIMFLPFESLYAEVLRIPGLFDQLQKEYKITITGPTTLSALLNSLQMGFRTLAIEKRSSEVWDLLGVVKTEFVRFGDVLDKTQKKLQEASNTIEQAGVRSRAIQRKLKQVQELPSSALPAELENDFQEEE